MADITKLDYSKPPPQYVVEPVVLGGRWCWDSLDPRDGVETMGYAPGPGQDAAIAAAWTNYKARNDPPGMIVTWEPDDKHFAPDGDGEWHVCLGGPVDVAIGGWTCWWKRCSASDKQRMEAEARDAAWAWHDTRLGLANTHDAAWPECLAYTDEICTAVLEGPRAEEAKRQYEEATAESLALIDFNAAPPGWVKDPIREWCHEPNGRRRPLDVAWSLYKEEHAPPGMWCGFSRPPADLDNCTLRAGVSACGRRWELTIDGRGPYSGWLKRSRAWAWAWHDRRHALTRDLLKDEQLLQTLGATVEFVQILCWHDEWVEEAEAWTRDKSRPIPEAFFTLMKREEVRQ